jgi:hypothetical protein
MGFVLAYDHDIFVSYAHINDLPWEGNAPALNPPSGWVTRFVRHVRERLQEKIGRAEVLELCCDRTHLRANHNLSAEIAAHLKGSALLIAIESPGYVASIWCRDEARLFTEHCGSALGNRIFIVQKEPLDSDEPPLPELSGRRNIQFWTFDDHKRERLLSWPMSPQDEVLYKEKVWTLVEDVYAQLKAMGGRLSHGDARPLTSTTLDSSLPAARVGGDGRPLVFLNTESAHQRVADDIRNGIGDRAIWINPLFEGAADEVREDLEQNIVDCNAMVMVYCDNASWARTQLRLLRKLEHKRAQPLPPVPVIDLPALKKPPFGIHGLETVTIDARAGITKDTLKRLSECLQL